MENIETECWNTNFENEFNEKFENFNFQNVIRHTYLLNTSKEHFNYIEKFIYDISMFHFKRLNIIFNSDYYIEFWFNNVPQLKELHIDTDEFERFVNNIYLTPLFSCVTYLNDNLYPTIITNMEREGTLVEYSMPK